MTSSKTAKQPAPSDTGGSASPVSAKRAPKKNKAPRKRRSKASAKTKPQVRVEPKPQPDPVTVPARVKRPDKVLSSVDDDPIAYLWSLLEDIQDIALGRGYYEPTSLGYRLTAVRKKANARWRAKIITLADDSPRAGDE